MPETAYDEDFDNGVLKKRIPRTVSDAEIFRRDAPARMRTFYPVARQWAADAAATYAAATAANAGAGRALTAAEQREMIRRLGLFFDGVADLLLQMSLDQ